MKQRILAGTLLLYVASFLQISLISNMAVLHIRPILPLCLMVVVALLRSPFESALMGFLFGLSMDFLLGQALGGNALLYLGAAVLIALSNTTLYKERMIIRMVFAFTATMVIEICYALMLFLLTGYEQLLWMIGVIIVPEAILNSILVMPLLVPIKQLYLFLDQRDRARNRIH